MLNKREDSHSDFDETADMVICGDFPCIVCKYNLRTQPTIGKCPECGSTVSQSVEAHIRSAVELARWKPLRWRIITKRILLSSIVLYSPGIIFLLAGMFGQIDNMLLAILSTPVLFPALLLSLSGGIPEVVLGILMPILSLLWLYLVTVYMIRLERRSKWTWPILLLLFCMSLASLLCTYIMALLHSGG